MHHRIIFLLRLLIIFLNEYLTSNVSTGMTEATTKKESDHGSARRASVAERLTRDTRMVQADFESARSSGCRTIPCRFMHLAAD
jgi:hypothetical protein